MNPIDFLLAPLEYEFFVRALIASALVGVACAVVGAFVVLKGMSFVGDAVSHSAFPGVVLAYLLGLPIILGGAVAAIGTALGIGAHPKVWAPCRRRDRRLVCRHVCARCGALLIDPQLRW
jgi:manganese/iron transport system permease protein